MTTAQRKYRTEYLKSREWMAVRVKRISAVRKFYGFPRCECCDVPFYGKEWKNVHHVTYPEDWKDTTVEQLRLVCVPCHKFIHSLVEKKKLPQIGDVDSLWLLTLQLSVNHCRRQRKRWNQKLSRRLELKFKGKPYKRKKQDMFFVEY